MLLKLEIEGSEEYVFYPDNFTAVLWFIGVYYEAFYVFCVTYKL